MKPLVIVPVVAFCFAMLASRANAQTLASGSDKSGPQLEALTKKIDEQNTKIDALSQQLLKLEQQISAIRPGVMIGEATPAASATSASATTAPAATADSGNAHVVAKGETLTSIAKAHKVGVQDLQKFNHIENDRALQIGQTIMLPSGASSPPPSASPSASPNE
ncbi:MAG: LysM domain-containing protein [Chthoniobacterales bacterium]